MVLLAKLCILVSFVFIFSLVFIKKMERPLRRWVPLADNDQLLEEILNSDDTDNDPNYEPPTKRVPLSLLTCLETRLREYRKQLNEARINGVKPTIRRKTKRTKQIENLIRGVKNGENVELSQIPNPFSSPPKKKIDGRSSPRRKENYKEVDSSNSGGSLVDSPTCSRNEDILEKSKSSGGHLIDSSKPTLNRKQNYCLLCKKLVKEFCKHFEAVHRNTEEGLKLQELNKIEDKILRKRLKTEITDALRKKGNHEFSKLKSDEMFMKEGKATVIPVKRSCVSSNQNNTVQCAHCFGFYKRRKFSVHVKKCKSYLNTITRPELNTTETFSNLQGNVPALKKHSIPVVEKVEGASTTLFDEVLSQMTPRYTKDVAMKDNLIMRYASEFHKTRRDHFQKDYVCRVITDLAKILIKMQDFDKNITCLSDIFNPAYFSQLVKCILEEAGYNDENGSLKICGLGNRLRSHIRAAAETALKDAAAEEYRESSVEAKNVRKRVKLFLKLLEDKWANEAGRIFDRAVKQSRTEKEPKLAAEEDIVKTCQFVSSKYRSTIQALNKAASGSVEKQQYYNSLLDFLVTHIMCLIRRRPVDFKRAQDMHYQKLDSQEDLINEIKNSKHMNLSEKDFELCNKFKIFYVPGKGWKEMVPIALTNIMKEAMDALQRNKIHVGINSKTLFVRAKEMPVNPRECLRKVTKQLVLKKPLDLCGNGLRHHAGTFSKLHSSHPNYQDYLASALGHTLHIHKLHYEMPTSIVQKLIVCPVLHDMTQPINAREKEDSTRQDPNFEECQPSQKTPEKIYDMTQPLDAREKEDSTRQDPNFEVFQPLQKTPEKIYSEVEDQDLFEEEDISISKNKRFPWTPEEKMVMYVKFGKYILDHQLPPRRTVSEFFIANEHKFKSRSVASLMSFLQSKCTRKAKNVTPEVKKYLTATTHRKITNVPL